MGQLLPMRTKGTFFLVSNARESRGLMRGVSSFLFSIFCFTASVAIAEPANRLRVGIMAPLSGPAAEYGVAIRNAMALQEKDSGGRPSNLELVFEDTAYNARAAVETFSRLRTIQHVDLLYVWGVVFCEAVAPLAEQFKVPMIAQCIQPNATRNRRSVVRFANPAGDYAAKSWEFLRSHSYKRLGIVLTDNAYLQLLSDALTEGKQGDETLTIVERFPAGQTDFRSTIVRLKGERFDALAVLLGPGQIGPFYRQLGEQHFSIPTIGSNLFESSGEISAAGEGIDGAVLANNAVNKEFQRRYEAEFGNLSQITFAAYAYDFAKLLQTYAPQYKGDAAKILSGLVQNAADTGVCGKILVKPDPEGGLSFTYPVVLKEIRNGKLHDLQ